MQKETFSETAYTTILKDNDMPESYRVELIDTKTGECHVNIFSGGNAELRAKYFIDRYYSKNTYHIIEWIQVFLAIYVITITFCIIPLTMFMNRDFLSIPKWYGLTVIFFVIMCMFMALLVHIEKLIKTKLMPK